MSVSLWVWCHLFWSGLIMFDSALGWSSLNLTRGDHLCVHPTCASTQFMRQPILCVNPYCASTHLVRPPILRVHHVLPDQVWSCSGHLPCGSNMCPMIMFDPVRAWSGLTLFREGNPPRHKVGRRPEADPCGAARILRERSDLKF